jgi:hypothetical protein
VTCVSLPAFDSHQLLYLFQVLTWRKSPQAQ